MKVYLVKWVDYCGEQRQKEYKTIEAAMKKVFVVCSWFKNGAIYRISDGEKIIGTSNA